MSTGNIAPHDSNAIVVMEGLHFGFPGGPDLACAAHAWHAGLNLLQGDEGVGKTALLCTLAGSIKRHAGSLTVNAAEVFWQHPRTQLSEAQLKTTSREWAVACAKGYVRWSDADFERHVQGFGLEEHMHKPLVALSTGSLRKLWMAAAWASGAQLTLIDEPFAALDNGSVRYVEDTLGEFTAEAQTERFGQASRCVIVAHWDAMQHVDWDDEFTLT